MGLLSLFLRKELRSLRSDSRVWPVYLLLPAISILLPTIFAIAGPLIARDGMAKQDPGIMAVARQVRVMADFAAMGVPEAMTRYLLRNAAGIFLLMPVALSTTAAAFSVVGEKQQRTLEPILATPITDRQFLLAKLLAALVPTVAVTWGAALVTTVLVDVVTWGQFATPLLPDRFWLVGVAVLAPLLGCAVVLVTMRLSAKSNDPQATVQAAALAVIPGFLIIIGLFGRLLTASFAALWTTCCAVAIIAVALFRSNVVTFQREEILTRWK